MQQGWWKTAEHRGGAAGTGVDHVGLLGLSAQAQESSPKQVPSRLPECRRGTYTGAGQCENQLGARGESR